MKLKIGDVIRHRDGLTAGFPLRLKVLNIGDEGHHQQAEFINPETGSIFTVYTNSTILNHYEMIVEIEGFEI